MNWNKTWTAAAFAGALIGSAPHAMAMEDTLVFMPGVDIGVPTAALPPPGVYSTTGFQYFNIPPVNGSGNKFGVMLHDYNASEQLLFVPQMPSILGANYAAFVVLPFRGLQAVTPGGTFGRVGMENTVISPLNLSWNLHNGFFVSAGFTFYANDGTYNVADPVHVSRNYWSFEPNFSVGYIDQNWLLNAHFLYDVSTKNNANGYQSGDVLVIDVTAMRKFGAFDFGVGATFDKQLTNDTINGVVVAASPGNGTGNVATLFGVGPTAAYHFGHIEVAGTVLFEPKGINVNSTQGVRSYISVSAPLWQPEAAPAKVAAKY